MKASHKEQPSNLYRNSLDPPWKPKHVRLGGSLRLVCSSPCVVVLVSRDEWMAFHLQMCCMPDVDLPYGLCSRTCTWIWKLFCSGNLSWICFGKLKKLRYVSRREFTHRGEITLSKTSMICKKQLSRKKGFKAKHLNYHFSWTGPLCSLHSTCVFSSLVSSCFNSMLSG